MHLLAAYLNPITRDDIYNFDDITDDIWDGQTKRDQMITRFVRKFKEFKILCKELDHTPKLKKTRGRPSKKLNNNNNFDIYSFNSNTNNSRSSINYDTDSDDLEDADQIPTEIQWYNNFNVDKLLKKYGERAINKNPLIFYRDYNENMFHLDQIAKWLYVTPLTSVGSEALFNPCGMTMSDRRTSLLQDLCSDIHTIQKWVESNGDGIDVFDDNQNDEHY